MLQFSNVKKEYGSRIVVSIPGLSVSEGIIWLNGANGSGKTTVLKMIGGLIPFSGDIFLYDVNQRLKPVEYRRIQSFSEAEPAYPHSLTGQELIRFHQDIRKASDNTTGSLIERFEFGKFLSAPIGSYSSGMLKRLSLLVSFIGHPKLIMLDEPLATLDAEAAVILPKLMLEYRSRYGCSFLFSSHHSFQDEILHIDQKLLIQNQIIQFVT
jgi:ABC-2 type transport system ATP-binding protein